MTDLQTDLSAVGARAARVLPELLERHDVPAAALGILLGDEVFTTSAGVLNLGTGVEATDDSVFQIGSITKVWTATLVMQLVDEGLVDLDAPVRTYLPGLTLADDEAAAAMTVRQLLSHTAGFEGDIFTDTGRGDDAIEKLVASFADVPQLFEPGALFSYNNAGYCVLGRLVEVLREKPYDDVLAERLFAPLGLTHAAAGPYEAIRFRVAMGHVDKEGGGQEPAPFWALAHSNGPAGAHLAMSAADLLAFARMHLDDGKAADGTQVLSPASVKVMQEAQVSLPDLRVMGTSWGLGWELFENAAEPMVGHDGNTVGQASFLRVVPGRRLAVTLLTNGGQPYDVFHDLVGDVLRELAGVELTPLPTPPEHPEPVGDASPYVGTYGNRVLHVVVSQDDDGRVWSELQPQGAAPDPSSEAQRIELVPLGPDVLVPLEPVQGLHIPHAFVGREGDGPARWLHIGRAMPRLTD